MFSAAAYEARLENRRQELQHIEQERFYWQIGLAQAPEWRPRLPQFLQMLLTTLLGR